ncbi:MAG: response regulator [Deltaproteobacteria bacterium]|nr:response regulator [Deltaproteobacteria bacterium]
MENIRVLLVDDENDFRRTVAKRLTKRGMDINQASGGEECLNILMKTPVDVVVLDLKMPDMDGMETLHHIKNRYPKVEVIMLTGHATTRDGVDGIKSGAFDYLSKPIELEHLAGKIRQAFEKRIREDEKQKEKDFRTKMEQQMIATERLASLGTLAAGVAHEINNPLAIIKESAGWMKSILQKKELAQMPRRGDFEMALGKIENGVERARRITHQLLGSVKQTDATLSKVDLKELVEETMVLHQKEATQKGVQLLETIDPGKNAIWSDPYKLRQVLINILSNAVHATDAGGKITLTAETSEDHVTFTISDTGRGIPREHLEKIFEPFFSTKPTGEGTGLGLFVTRSIIHKLGGEIDVESRVGQGTRFSVKLPKHPDVKCDLNKG